MLIQPITNNNSHQSFTAKLDIKPVKDMISSEEIAILAKKAADIGNKNSIIKVDVGSEVSRWSVGDHREGDVLNGYNMVGTTYHRGKLEHHKLDVIKSEFDTILLNYDNKIIERFKPFNVINNWMDTLFKSSNTK